MDEMKRKTAVAPKALGDLESAQKESLELLKKDPRVYAVIHTGDARAEQGKIGLQFADAAVKRLNARVHLANHRAERVHQAVAGTRAARFHFLQ